MVPNVRVHEQTWVLSFFFLPMAPCSSWSNLPRELIDRIFRRPMDSKDLARCTLVCTDWRNIIGIYMFVSLSTLCACMFDYNWLFRELLEEKISLNFFVTELLLINLISSESSISTVVKRNMSVFFFFFFFLGSETLINCGALTL